jgi:general secretion pathway protein A
MYQSFFKLTRNPFEVSPDPYFLYPTAQHKEALAGLYYGIKARKGFMVLTGEVGTGKSLVVRCLQDLLDRQRVAYAYVFNTSLSCRQFLEYVAEDLGVPHNHSSKSGLLIQLSRHLIERHRQGLATVLVVDEAQHLGFLVLEEIRLLTNLETSQGKLLQIVLVGQPELDAKVEDPALRQLKQRIALRFQLRVLSEPETSSYVQCRLKLAGDESGDIFAPPALERVHFYSGGIPRLINILCDNAMLSTFAVGQNQVTPELIDEAALDLRLEAPETVRNQELLQSVPQRIRPWRRRAL